MKTRSIFLAMALLGCDGGTVDYSGLKMSPFFPFDGSAREWEFVNEDTSIAYKQVSVLNTEFEVAEDGATKIYDVETSKVCVNNAETCEDAWLYTTRMSVTGAKGAMFHGYSNAEGQVDFETPIEITAGKMEAGDFVTTTGVDGHDWVATFERIEACEIQWTSEWTDCARIKLESTPEGHWMAGTYWAVTGYNIVARQTTGDTGRWELIYAKWEP